MADAAATRTRMIADFDAATDHIHVLYYIWLIDGMGIDTAEATHYKGMASSMMRKFNKDTNAIKIIQTPNGSILQRATTEEMTETAHDKRYNEIMAFINRVTNDDKIEQLRVFVDHEMRSRYKQQLELLNLSENDSFHDCMIKLKELNHISERCFTYLDDFRGSLNTPLHNIEERSVEDSRTYADNMMRFIYTEL